MNTIYCTLLSLLLSQIIAAQSAGFLELLEYYAKEKQFNGVALVATNGEIDFLHNSGLAQRDIASLINTDSKFKIASMSKVYTAVLVMKLVEEGKLDLNGTLGMYLPNYGGQGKDQVTVHHLLTYSSGIENILDVEGLVPYQTLQSLDKFVDMYCSGNLVFTPGAQSAYGNTEYIILHKIIEAVSGMSYEDYLHAVILEPIGLTNTGMVDSQNSSPDLVEAYLYSDSLKVYTKEAAYYPEQFFGSGAMYATAEDILNFDQAIFKHEILSPASTEKLLTIHPELGYAAYGFWGSSGWGNFEEPFYYRTGGIQGSNANWIHAMNSGKTIIVLSNTNATNLFELSEQLYLLSIGKGG